MGSGDEVRCASAPRDCPHCPLGWKRDFLLLVDGWAKDADANTAFSQSVLPLPFHSMSRYPYPGESTFPNDAEHDAISARIQYAAGAAPDPAAAEHDSGCCNAMTETNRAIASWLLIVNSAYIAAFAASQHLLHGQRAAASGARTGTDGRRALSDARRHPVECGAFLLSGLPAIFLAVRGNTMDHRWALWSHIVLAVVAVVIIGLRLFHHARRVLANGLRRLPSPCSCFCPRPARSTGARGPIRTTAYRIPPWRPSPWTRKAAARTRPLRHRRRKPIPAAIIPSNFFMDSEFCGNCHKDIYDQWKGSMHHFASFNNQFYRKSIEYMQDVVGTRAQQVVRRMPRSRGLLQWPLRPAHQGTDRYAGSAGRARLHVVPRHRARGQQHGQRRFHGGVSAAARTGLQQEQVHPRDRLLPDVSQSEAAQGHVHEAVHARAIGRVLRVLPQGASGCSGQQLPLGARVQRLRQLAGERRFGTGRALVLLSAQDVVVLGLPHAAGGVARIRAIAKAKSIRIASRPPIWRWRTPIRTRRS